MRSLIADLGDAYRSELRRTRIGPFDVADADAERVAAARVDALGMFRSVALDGDDARTAAHGVAVPAPGPLAEPRAWRVPEPPSEVLLLDADGPIALAEPRDDGLLKPVVGFRA